MDYRNEARSIREMAAQVKNVEARDQLLQIAFLYEKLADLSDDSSQSAFPWATGQSDAV
ncbi:MAG: hypothetical protein JWN43_212 [Gammaproteobacteria bacterium]|nr:hypothetical protein [Gammaproteobacteria bacterium]